MNAKITLLGDDNKMALLAIEQGTCTLVVIADPTTAPYWDISTTATPLDELCAYLQAHFAGWYMCDPLPYFFTTLDKNGYIHAQR